MKKAFILIFIFGISLAASTAGFTQDSYRIEMDGGYFNQKSDRVNVDLFILGGQIFLNEIELDDYPYAEAAFYQEASFIRLNAHIGKGEVGDGEQKIKGFDSEIKLMMPFSLFAVFSYERTEWDGDMREVTSGFLLDVKSTANIYGGDLGFYLFDGLAIALSSKFEDKKNNIRFDPTSYNENEKIKTNNYGSYLKYVALLDDDMSFNLKCSYLWTRTEKQDQDIQKNSTYAIEGDFYFTSRFGIGGGFLLNIGDEKKNAGKKYSMRMEAFLGPNFGFLARYEIFKAEENSENDNKSFMLLLGCRI